jgi:hypothetical protein
MKGTEISYTLSEVARELRIDRRRLQKIAENIKPYGVCYNGRRLYRLEQFGDISTRSGQATRMVAL